MYNFKNVPKSLAYRHQYSFQAALVSKTVYKDSVEVSSGFDMRIRSLPCSQQCVDFLNCSDSDDVFVLTKFSVCGQFYVKGQILALRMHENGLPVFGQLAYGVLNSTQALGLIVRFLLPLEFDSHMCCYIGKSTENYEFVLFKSLLDYHPLDSYPAPDANESYIAHRYLLF